MSLVRSGATTTLSSGGGGGGGQVGTGPDGMLDITQAPYNCVANSGTTDNGPGLRQACADSITSGRPVWMPPNQSGSRGSYDFTTTASGGAVVELPLDLAAQQALDVRGIKDQTVLRLKNSLQTMFGQTTVLSGSPYSHTLRNLRLSGFVVDANSIGGGGSAGTLIHSASEINYDTVTLEDLRGINGSSAVNASRRWINLQAKRLDAFGSSGVLSTVKHITMRRVDLTGHTTGYLLTSFIASATPAGDVTGGSDTITNVSSFDRVYPGQSVGDGGVNIPGGTTIVSTNPGAGTIKMTANATGTAAATTLTLNFNQANVPNGEYLAHPSTPLAYTFFDDIIFDECRWQTLTEPVTNNQIGSGLQACSQGWADRVLLRKCYMRGSGDVGYEVQPVLDLTYDECVAENCWNFGFFASINHGGNPWAGQQIIRHNGCQVVRSNAAHTPFIGFGATAQHGGQFGELHYNECTFRNTADWAASANPGAEIRGPFRRLRIVGHKTILDQTVQTAIGQTNQSAFAVHHSGNTGVVEIDGLAFEVHGSSAAVTTQLRTDTLLLSTGSKLHLRANGITTRTDFDKGTGGYGFSPRTINIAAVPSVAFPCVEEAFANNQSFYLDHAMDSGLASDLLQRPSTTGLTSIANHTTRKLWRWPGAEHASTNTNNTVTKVQIGRCLDNGLSISGLTPAAWTGAALSWELICRLSVDDDGVTALRARMYDDGAANTVWALEKVASDGTVSTLFGPANVKGGGGRLTAGSPVTLRAVKRGDTILLDQYNRAFDKNGDMFATGTGDVPQAVYTLTGGDVGLYGSNSIPLWVGYGWTPGDATATLSFLRHFRLGVLASPSIRGTHELGHRKATTSGGAQGLVVSAPAGHLRIAGKAQLGGWDRRAIRREPGNPVDVSLTDPAMAAQIEFADSVLGFPPAAGPAALTVGTIGGAGSFYYQNLDMCVEDLLATGGTLTPTAVTVASLTGGTTSGVATVYGASSLAGLSAGQTVTGTGIPGGTTVTGIVQSSTFVGTAAGGSGVITGVADTTALAVGQGVTGTGVPANAVITALTSSQVTVNKTVTAGTGVTFTASPTVLVSANASATSANQAVAFAATMQAVAETTQDPTGLTGWQPIQFSAGDLKHRLAAGGIVRWYGSGQPMVRKVPAGVS